MTFTHHVRSSRKFVARFLPLLILLNWVASTSLASETPELLHPLFSGEGPSTPIRSPASQRDAGREQLDASINPLAPDRQPTSVKSNKQKQKRSTLPSQASEGFELRVRYNRVTTLFWVIRQADRFELVHANSSGSRSTLTLSADVFRQLNAVARSIRARDHDIRKCPEASMQIHVLIQGKGEKSFTSCVANKSKDAQTLRDLSQSLALIVR